MRQTCLVAMALWMGAWGTEAFPGSGDLGRAETLFAKVRGSNPPQKSPSWKEFLAHPEAVAVARQHLECSAEPDRGQAAAITALAALEGAKAADDCARLALESKGKLARQSGHTALISLDVPTPDRVVEALKDPFDRGARAMEIVKARPDEKGLFGIVVAVDAMGYGGGGPSSYIANATQQAYVQDYTAVVQVGAVGYDPEIAYVSTAQVLEAKVLRVEEYRRTLYEVTGVRFPSKHKAVDWWEAHKAEVLKRIEGREGGKAPIP